MYSKVYSVLDLYFILNGGRHLCFSYVVTITITDITLFETYRQRDSFYMHYSYN